MSILVITTGGTIGAMPYANPLSPPEFSEMPEAGRDLVRAALTRDFADVACRCVSLEPRDSKLIDKTYRDNIIKIIDETPDIAALVTHGTDTILETAAYFHNKWAMGENLKGKIVILTGAMTPLSNGVDSDGYLNLKFSLVKLAAGHLKSGVNIVLCDYEDVERQTGWTPRLYPFAPGRYKKFYNSTDGRRNRILVNQGPRG